MNLNNSVNFEKDSKERLNLISNKIKDCIIQIKNKENAINPKKLGHNKYMTIANDSELQPSNKYENSTPCFNKNKSNKTPKYYQTIFYKRMNNYNDIIHEKKNVLLNINSLLNNRFQRNSNYGKHTLYSLKIKSPNERKAKNYFSFDETYNNNIGIKEISSNNSSIDHDYKYKNINGALNDIKLNKRNKRNKMKKLEYEFEIRRLRRKLEKVKEENIEIKDKLDDIKKKNIILEKKILKGDEQKNILSDLILLNKQYTLYDNSNGFDIKYGNQNKIDNDNDNDSFDDLILNIMDIKYYYENSLLTNEFIDGVSRLLYGMTLSKNGNRNSNDLIKSLNDLINIRHKSFYYNNKYKNFLQDKYKYYLFLTDLMKKFKLNNFSEIDNLIKNNYLNIKDNGHEPKLKNNLIKDFSFGQKNNEEKSLYSDNNHIFSNKNYYTKLQNYLNAKKGISRIKQKNTQNYFEHKRKKNPNNYLSQIEKSDSINKNYTVRNKKDSFININNYYQTFYNKNNSYERKNNKKINLNFLDNKVKKNNNLINNERSIDFIYNNNIGNMIGNTYIKRW